MAPEVKVKKNGIWETAYDGVHLLLKKPNHYQNGVQFRSWWMTSKLEFGNTYVLKQRDSFGKIEALYILDPRKVEPLLTPNGEIYYKLKVDNLTGVGDEVVVPAYEIIHDRYQPQDHPLIGVSPIFGAALSGALGKQIQNDSYHFFKNGSNVSGILTAPGPISQATRERLEQKWNENFTGKNAGRTAVVGDGLKFEAMRAKGIDSQLVEQLKISAEIVASCFHVPPFKISMAKPPEKPHEANLIYYGDCLQVLIEEMEACLDAGLELSEGKKIELDTDDLLRMNKSAVIEMLSNSVKGSITTPNEARKEINLKPLIGGDTVYMQQQNFSLEALAKRDSKENPFDSSSEKEDAKENAKENKEVNMEMILKLFNMLEKENADLKKELETFKEKMKSDKEKQKEIIEEEIKKAVESEVEKMRASLKTEDHCDVLEKEYADLKKELETFKEKMKSDKEKQKEIIEEEIKKAVESEVEKMRASLESADYFNMLEKENADLKKELETFKEKMKSDKEKQKEIIEEEIKKAVESEVEKMRASLESADYADKIAKRASNLIEKPKDGKDGLPADSIKFEQDGRILKIFVGEKSHQIKLESVIDCGVWDAGKAYDKGDGVTSGGNYWIAQKDTKDAPGTSKDWRMAVRKGRDGRDLRDNASTIDKSKGVKF